MTRIVCNYARLFSTLLIGIAVVPLTIAWLGDDAFGLIAFLGANIGLAAIFRQIIQQSLVRELASAYHAGDAGMARLYPAICRISVLAALLSSAAFGIVALALPLFNMPDEFRAAAFWFVIAQGAQSALMIFLAPVLNMYLVSERFIGYSIWYVGVRATNIISVVVLGYVITIHDPPTGLLLHGILWSALSVLGFIVAAVRMVRLDPRLKPTLRRPEPGAVREVMGTFSWNSGVQIAMNLHEQIPQFLLNLFLGTIANAAWGIGFRLVAYIRMVTTGMQFGSDAVSARLASDPDADLARSRLQRLVGQQTRLTGLVSLPAGAFVLIYCFPVLHLWVGPRLEDYDGTMGMGVVMARILSLALAARAVSDTWILVLYGAGFVRRYALLIMAGGLIAPATAITLLLTLPDEWRYIGPAVGYGVAFIGLHLLGVPVIAARCLHLSTMGLIGSLGRPLLATGIAAAAGLGVLAYAGRIGDLSLTAMPNRAAGDAIEPFWMLASIAAFGAVYAPLAIALVLGPQDRQRLMGVIRGRLLRRDRTDRTPIADHEPDQPPPAP
ncbi:MAG: hypothetical protein LAT64_04685 [Phycisphaerales bacterium]|nr:hypothetical protein [Planctomycetota bacterium]MCH8508050.1 hypothetical protein [Phycisphaerales bacterium]